MKLYEAPRESIIEVLGHIHVPPEAIEIVAGEILVYKYIDGMYGVCYNKNNQRVYLAAYADVELI